MRKFARVLPLLCVALALAALASCGTQRPPPPPAAFSAEAHISFGEKNFRASVQQFDPGALRFSFTAPKELAGMELSIEGDTASLCYREAQYTQPLETLPRASFAACLNQALLQLAQPEQPGQDRFTRAPKGGWTLKGESCGLRYRAKIAPDGSLRRLDVPAVSLGIDLRY